MDHLIPWLRLQLTPGLGRAAQFRLINHFGSIENILDARPQEWPKLYRVRSGVADKIPPAQSPQVEQACEKLAQAEAWACTFWDDNYP
ncbi:MAG: hypothetical protein OET90_10065, partial [Desulfuromonadales bacterium]|nr:hypothetical protein [Desulfuromonadales bacterium]